uniref:Uncharacterized protein n=1 Tax=Acrobeloides nanus TaxID=290746 RepID=A0A914E868_9BILA
MIKQLYYTFFILLLAIAYTSAESIQVEGIVQCCVAQPTPIRPKRFLWMKSETESFPIDKRSIPHQMGKIERIGRAPSFGSWKSMFEPNDPALFIESSNDDKGSKSHFHDSCEPLSNATIEIWEEDNALPGDSDDFLNRTITARNGRFEIQGIETELGSADFYVKLNHTCGMSERDVKAGCKRITIKKVPRQYNSKNWKLYNWQIFSSNSGDIDKTKC